MSMENVQINFKNNFETFLSAVRTRVIEETENNFYCRKLETRKTTLELFIHVFSIKLFTYKVYTKYDQGWIDSEAQGRTDNIEELGLRFASLASLG